VSMDRAALEHGRARHLVGAWCRVLVDALHQAGVREVAISPGSRSTPLVVAIAEHPGLRAVDVVDERSAAFFALGMARVTGRPAALVCTSGTAAAHYFPAVIEAASAHLPLLVLTADRPLELQGCGAPQTIDQVRLFGEHARAFFDLGAPDPSPGALRALRRTAAQAVLAARWPTPGPVHLDVRAKKPLEPGPPVPGDPECEALEARLAALARASVTRAAPPVTLPADEALAAVVEAVVEHPRGLIVLGPAQPGRGAVAEEILQLSARTGYPVLAEASSQLRFRLDASAHPDAVVLDAFPWLLGAPLVRERLRPEVILQLGAPPTLGSYAALLEAAPDARRFVLAPHGWNDPFSSAEALVLAELEASVPALLASLDGVERGPEELDWGERWAAADRRARAELDGVLTERSDERLGEAEVVAQAIAAVPEHGLLVLSNSLPVRHADAYARGRAAGPTVLSQRGASGIDGLGSGAAGAAFASGAPVLALLGDLAALHDLGGLAVCRMIQTPLALVVINNDGGRIFEQLPIAERAAERPDGAALLARFTTPQGLDFSGAAAMFGLPYRPVRDRGALADALAEALARPGPTLIEAFVPPGGARALQRTLAARVEASLEALLGG
jgi:2-succinyl-5-enolpyruvyl-6-hydroxy-3-cyclohexene-1-carboxylate synthase